MELSLTTGIILVILILAAYHFLFRSPWKHLPPGPPSFPLIGSLPYMGGDILGVFSKMAAKYGNVFSVGMGPHSIVILNGYETIKEALNRNRAFDGRPDMFDDIDNHRGIVSSEGEIWKSQRRWALHTLRDFGLGKRSMENLIHEEASHLITTLKASCGRPYCPAAGVIQKAVANIISVILFGKRSDYKDRSITTLLDELQEALQIAGSNNPATLFKFLRWIPGDPFSYQKATNLMEGVYKRFRGEIEVRKRSSHAMDPGVMDLITLYLKHIPEWKDLGNYAFFEKELEYVIENLYVAGVDTTSNTLQWALLYLILNPDIQTKIHLEIDDVIGQEGVPCMQHQLSMPYTSAFISEIQRLGDIAPLIPHAAVADTVFRGYDIPKGTMVMVNLHSVHYDPVLWPQPDECDPGRFLDKEGKYQKREEFIPFSLGKRACLGEGLARMEIFLFLTRLLQAFTFKTSPDQPTPSTEGIIGVTRSPQPFDVVMDLRN